MTWLQFISSIVGSLAWPVCAVFIALIFRKRFSDLLAKLLKLNLPGGFSAEFEKGLARVEGATTVIETLASSTPLRGVEKNEHSSTNLDVSGQLSSTEEDEKFHVKTAVSEANKIDESVQPERKVFKLSDLAGPSTNIFDFYEASVAQPAGVVMEAWKLLEAEIVGTVAALLPNLQINASQGIGPLLTVLVEKNILTQNDVQIFEGLKRLRNLAVHSQEPIAPDEARRFATISAVLGEKLRRPEV